MCQVTLTVPGKAPARRQPHPLLLKATHATPIKHIQRGCTLWAWPYLSFFLLYAATYLPYATIRLQIKENTNLVISPVLEFLKLIRNILSYDQSPKPRTSNNCTSSESLSNIIHCSFSAYNTIAIFNNPIINFSSY